MKKWNRIFENSNLGILEKVLGNEIFEVGRGYRSVDHMKVKALQRKSCVSIRSNIPFLWLKFGFVSILKVL